MRCAPIKFQFTKLYYPRIIYLPSLSSAGALRSVKKKSPNYNINKYNYSQPMQCIQLIYTRPYMQMRLDAHETFPPKNALCEKCTISRVYRKLLSF